jgi:hypothetical protein
MSIQVNAPTRVPYRYGLLSTAQIQEHVRANENDPPAHLRLQSNYQFDSVACNTGAVWDPSCAPPFTVTFTRTAVTDQFTVTATPGVLADYEYNVNGGAFTTLTSPIVIAAAPPVTVVVREVGGLQRSVTRTDINPDSPAETQFVFRSTQTANPPKTVTEGIGNRTAEPFVVIGGVACTLIATPDIEQKARDALSSVEERLVEQQFWTVQLANSAPALPAGGAPVPLTQGVAALEEYLRNNTGWVGMIHSDAYVAPFAARNELISELNPEMVKRTPLWTPWVFGGGYARTGPVGQAAPVGADQAWIYATGSVVIHRGETSVPGGVKGGFSVTTNQDFVIAERTYVVIADCPTAAVLVDLDA